MTEQTWVTDKFYSHFPSCTDEYVLKRNFLLQSRKQDYQDYLKQMLINDDEVTSPIGTAATVNTSQRNRIFNTEAENEAVIPKSLSRKMISSRVAIGAESDSHCN